MYTAELIYKGEKVFVKEYGMDNGTIGIAIRFFQECNSDISLRRMLLTGNATLKLFTKDELVYKIELENLNPKK